ncbi:hypothetical protein DB346_23710 [Verrucomicrobia bacterium LW23]|nr:hypothetical protein DB346_23710 [Verrucomicrobia bacterium LW23]
MDVETQLETLVIRINPSWKRELEHIKAERAELGSVVSLSEIVRQQLAPWLQSRIAGRSRAAITSEHMSLRARDLHRHPLIDEPTSYV